MSYDEEKGVDKHIDETSVPALKTPTQLTDITEKFSTKTQATSIFQLGSRTYGALFALWLSNFACWSAFVLTANTETDLGVILGDTANAGWLANAYSITNGVVIICSGTLSDIFGRRYFFLFGNALGTVACIIAATANKESQVIAGMALQGVSGALQFLSTAAIAEVLPNKFRPFGQALVELGLAVWSIVGSMIAHAIISYTTWRWIYYIGIICNAAALIATAFLYFPPSNPRNESRISLLKRLDFVGIFLLAGGLISLLLGISFGGSKYSWGSAGTVAPIVIGIAALVVLGFWEVYGGRKNTFKICPPELFRQWRTFTVACICLFMTRFISNAGIVNWSILAGVEWSSSTFYTGVLAIPQGVGVVGTIVGLSFVYRRIGHTNYQLMLAQAGLCLFSSLWILNTPDNKPMAIAFSMVQACWIGYGLIAGQLQVIMSVPHEWLGFGMGCASAFGAIGGSVGQVISTTILSNRIGGYIASDVVIPAIEAGLPPTSAAAFAAGIAGGESQEALLAITGVTGPIIAIGEKGLKWAFIHTFRVVFKVSIAFTLCGFVAALFAKDVSSNFTDHVAVNLDKVKEEGGHKE